MDNFEQAEKLRNEITETFSRLSYIAAGTISLSITFLGFVMSIGQLARSVLNFPIIFEMPIIYILFCSWMFLAISLFGAIYIRIPMAWFLYKNHLGIWLTSITEKYEIGKYQDVINLAKIDENRHDRVSARLRQTTLISFVLGILSLLWFVIIVAIKLTNV